MHRPPSFSPSDAHSTREQLVQELLLVLGRSWGARYFQELEQAERCTAGGWPGRLAEARALALRELPRQLAERGLTPASSDELASAPSIVNEHARNEWARAGKARRRLGTGR